MDPRNNPYNPGSGVQPPELAGRDSIIEKADIALDRLKAGRPIRGFIFYGLRGVGKTVLLNKIRMDAESHDIAVVYVEAQENKSLPAILIPSLRSTLLKISLKEKLKDKVSDALKALAGFTRALKVKFQDIEVSFDIGTGGETGVADSGDLESDLADLLLTIGKAAKDVGTSIAIIVDEFQNVPEEQMAALIRAFHHLSQNQQPIILIAAGLPQLLGQMGDAKSYAERLFEFIHVDKLSREDAKTALCKPAEKEGAKYTSEAVEEIVSQTQGYPHFLQEWGRNCWELADNNNITLPDAEKATILALQNLDQSFFRVRFDRLTPTEKNYVRAMAELGPGPHRSGDIAAKLGRASSNVAPTRASLIQKGMIYSPNHGDTAFTAPLFDGFLKRTVPKFPV